MRAIARTGGVYPRARWRAHDFIADYLCKNELSRVYRAFAPYLRSPGGSIREVRHLRTRSHTFLASRREPLAGSGVLGVIMAEQVSRPLAPRPLSPHGCGRGQCVGGYGTRPRAKAVHLPEGGTPMVHFATNSFGGRRVTTRLSPCGPLRLVTPVFYGTRGGRALHIC